MKKNLTSFVLFVAVMVIVTSCSPCGENNQKNNVMENILNRRSVRSYTQEKVSKEDLDKIVQAGINAPSARNNQPWEIRVIQDEKIINKIKATGVSTFDAPVLIVIAHDTTSVTGQFDCGLLTQNIVLSAEALDLGTCINGTIPRVLQIPENSEIVKSFQLSENYEVLMIITLGHKAERPDAKPRIVEKVKFL